MTQKAHLVMYLDCSRRSLPTLAGIRVFLPDEAQIVMNDSFAFIEIAEGEGNNHREAVEDLRAKLDANPLLQPLLKWAESNKLFGK